MTTFTDEVRETFTPWGKFSSRRAALAWHVSLDGTADEETGSTEWDVWVARIGRTLVSTDDRGFVDARRYATEEEARAAFEMIDNAYAEWEGDN